MTEYDVIIVGLGAGGIGAAIKLSENNRYKIAVIEKNERIGGTMIAAGVNTFESGIAVGKVQRMLAERLMQKGQGMVQRSLPALPEDRFGFSVACDEPYWHTYHDEGILTNLEVRRFMYDDTAMELEVLSILNSADVHLYNGNALTNAAVENRRIKSVTATDKSGNTVDLTAKIFIDCTGNVSLAYLCGCETTMVQESKSVYGEEFAPEVPRNDINGVSLIFRLSEHIKEDVEAEPEIRGIDVSEWYRNVVEKNDVWFCANVYPNGDLNINMLPTMTGKEYYSMSPETAYKICKARVFAFWNYLKRDKRFAKYKLKYIFPVLGVREERRIVGEYVLTQYDVYKNAEEASGDENFVAYSDHMIDTHGCDGPCPRLRHAYGIPYGCLLTKEIDNMLVASKGCSFSHIAASSCRLSRTIMDIGEAAANACITAFENRIPLRDVRIGAEFPKSYSKLTKLLKKEI